MRATFALRNHPIIITYNDGVPTRPLSTCQNFNHESSGREDRLPQWLFRWEPSEVLPPTQPGCNPNGSVGKEDHNEPGPELHS